jgi:transcriptional regulator
MEHETIDLPQGTVDLLILKILSLGPRHGWSIAERLHQSSSAALQIKQGSLYPALHRLQRRGWLKASWGASDTNRRAKYYELTRKGRAQLETEASAWQKLSAAISQILENP